MENDREAWRKTGGEGIKNDREVWRMTGKRGERRGGGGGVLRTTGKC